MENKGSKTQRAKGTIILDSVGYAGTVLRNGQSDAGPFVVTIFSEWTIYPTLNSDPQECHLIPIHPCVDLDLDLDFFFVRRLP